MESSLWLDCEMPTPPSPEDRPDPNDQLPAVRARVPEHVARGDISTGVIVVTGGTEFVLDFVRSLPRPNAIVARVVLPHLVMPQFIEALTTNIDLYRQRYGDLPGAPPIVPLSMDSHIVHAGASVPPVQPPSPSHPQQAEFGTSDFPEARPSHEASNLNDPGASGVASGSADESSPIHPQPPHAAPPAGVRRQNPQEIYDELKIRDEILSGAYANAVMIGHGPHEFSFDFITNFYPQSAVSSRVYMASGHVWRMLDSLKQSWDQLRPRLGFPPPPGPGPGTSGHGPSGHGPSGHGPGAR
ncbi:MAG: DUF3467 domain-containing protein [Pirellula sp.]|jgi:hypothetical protein|nr:DUF3467 domain-containing protein [Pirellula sp.]